MAKFTESSLVEDYFIKKLQEKGYKFIPAESLGRDSIDEPLLIPNLVKSLKRINEKSGIGDDETNKVLNELKLTSTGIEGAKRILNYYKNGIPVKFEKERVVKYVNLFDYEDINNNEFVISRQVYHYGKDTIRNDIIIYVNGIPLVNIECKNPVSISENWYTAYRQIKDYERIAPELYKYIQIGVAAESTARYFPIVPWQNDTLTYEWHHNEEDLVDSIIEMLSRETLLDIIKNFLFFRIEHGNATKVITRYMQYRAANKIFERVVNNFDGKDDKNKGLIWHWQGSGKTLTMIFAAYKLYYEHRLENPSIFFVVDRIDLETQLYNEFNSLDIVKPEVINSVRALRDVLSYDDYRGKRGIFITLIHKFRPEELKLFTAELNEVSRSKETIIHRNNVITFIDEAHRTQYGVLASQMRNILKSAFYFALTGTPIAKSGKDTYIEFSYPPEEKYLDRYFISDSIRDGFTVKIVYQPRLEKELKLKEELLENFLETEFEEIPEEIKEEVETQIKKRMSAIVAFLENPERIKVIAQDIADHFIKNVDGRFKAMVVAGSRKACHYYKEELDKHLPAKYSEIVMTYNSHEEGVLGDRVRETIETYGTRDIGGINKEIIENFKEEEYPKILIVTDMLLTGFDAPILQVMYLDKPLKEHRLLQAIARTNRPYKGLKEAGLIIDYVGVLGALKRALYMYDETDIKHALFNYEILKNDFIDLLNEILDIFKGLYKNYDRETLLKAIEILTTDIEKEKLFTEKYNKLRKIFEMLGPHEVKLEYLDEYKWISGIYTYYSRVVSKKAPIEDYLKKYYEKTVNFIHKATEIEKLEKELPLFNFDEKYFIELEEKIKSKKEKAANILFTLNKLVLVDRHKNPVYESLIDKVERLFELWKEKNKDYEKIYSDGINIFNEIKTLKERQKSLDLSDFEYSILLVLEEKFGRRSELVSMVKEITQKINIHMFPGWFNQATSRKNVERELRRFARGIKKQYNISLEEMDDLYNRIIERVKNYGIE